MFFLPSRHSNMMKTSEEEAPNWVLRGWVLASILIIAGATAAFNWKVEPKAMPFARPPNQAETVMLNMLKAFECVYFGIAFTFIIFMGWAVSQVAKKFRAKMILIYVCMSWCMVSWFPHITLHTFYPTIWGVITLDLVFHMTVVAASCVLAYFILRLMQAAARYKVRPITEWTPMGILRADWVQICLITIPIGFFFFGITYAFPVSPGPPLTPVQNGLLKTLCFAESLLVGMGIAFALKMIPVIKRMQGGTVRTKAIVMSVSITWMLISWYPHVRLHEIRDNMGMFPIPVFITVDVVFHWTVMAAASVMSYALFGVIMMAVDYSKSPFRDMERASSGTVSAKIYNSAGSATVPAPESADVSQNTHSYELSATIDIELTKSNESVKVDIPADP